MSIQNTQKIKQYEAKNRIMKHRSNRMTYRGRMKNGVIVLESPASLPEGSEVEVNPLQEDQNIPTLHERLKDVIGAADGLPADSSVNHDHYLYGVPKK
ncbi:MAG TPA: hypothetical protein VHX86_03545 [Tepidisphaeraceae bacterium]|nr:hypothetical protein [Tepidisphaeraceae bacterium]